MKKILALLLFALCISACNRVTSIQTGVWVSDNAELLMTDSLTLYFEKQSDSSVVAIVKVKNHAEEYAVFSLDTVVRSAIPDSFKIEQTDGNEISVNGNTLVKVEDVETCSPYDMPAAIDSSSIADRLTEWRLGINFGFDEESGDIIVEANTNENMFIYYIHNGMYYLRAAKIANVNKGTLFFQNIRLMKNPNTKENTMYFAKNNRDILLNELKVDMEAFNPDNCYFSPDGGIYWSYVSHTPDQIVLNGCGEIYQVNRQLAADDGLFEWIKPNK